MATENDKVSAKASVRKKTATPGPAAKKKTAARKKTAAQKRPSTRQAAGGKKAALGKAPSATREAVTKAVRDVYTREQRHKMIATMAYFLAEKRGFAPGNSDQDWLESERLIDELLKKQGIELTD